MTIYRAEIFGKNLSLQEKMFQLEPMIKWAESKDPNETYCYTNPSQCAVQMYCDEVWGIKDGWTQLIDYEHRIYRQGESSIASKIHIISLGDGKDEDHYYDPLRGWMSKAWTFGRLAERLRNCLERMKSSDKNTSEMLIVS